MFDFFKNRRRAHLRAVPLPDAWRAILERNVPYVRLLDEAERRELEGLVQIFLAEKHFEGCGGLELDDEIRVTIAAQACLLLLRRDGDVYPDLDAILVYPDAYLAPNRSRDGAVVSESVDARLGEASTRGVVVLSWKHALRGGRKPADGHNVVLHEFAHQLDGEDGAMDGAPDLEERERYAAWARVLGAEFGEMTDRLHAGRATTLDPYGARNPQEFFAVATETFFEKPQELRKKHPELYAELVAFYEQDPAERLDERAREG